jgi:hypothetical protein
MALAARLLTHQVYKIRYHIGMVFEGKIDAGGRIKRLVQQSIDGRANNRD